ASDPVQPDLDPNPKPLVGQTATASVSVSTTLPAQPNLSPTNTDTLPAENPPLTGTGPTPAVPAKTAPVFKQPDPAPITDTEPAQSPKSDPLKVKLPPSRLQISTRKILVGLILFILMAGVGLLGAVAATGNLEETVLTPIQKNFGNIPFLPRSKNFIIQQMVSSEATVSSYDFDVSFGLNFESQEFVLGSESTQSNIDIAAKGSLFLNPDDNTVKTFGMDVDFKTIIPPYNGQISLGTAGTTDVLYLQLKSVTGGFSDFAQYLPPAGEWYYLDLAPLESQARDVLDSYQLESVDTAQQQEEYQQKLQQVAADLYSDPAIQDNIELVGDETLSDGTTAHHLSMTPTAENLAEIFIQLAQVESAQDISPDERLQITNAFKDFTDFKLDIWIDEDLFMLRKMVWVFTYLYDSANVSQLVMNDVAPVPLMNAATQVLADTTSKDTIQGSFVMEFTNVNNATAVDTPQNAVLLDDYLNSVMEPIGLTSNFENARNAQTQSDVLSIGTALESYFIENNGLYPVSLGELSPTYISQLPTRPSDLDTTCTPNYSYVSTSTEAAVWAEIEPCSDNPVNKNYIVYRTVCGRTTQINGGEFTDVQTLMQLPARPAC
ncbi:hypothetical protein KC571_01180, partial [candidate division WWE3 bacterium]|nr:hypothetical protein [candidate division WWE3 bacterium]